ncbi:MAG: cyclopropane fatty acyl phospholipid synthase [Lysobacterales bacterium]|nr:MAG: cyclopropane fatty acyl phospholipid synthase [Xanthomonadales bacterium]
MSSAERTIHGLLAEAGIHPNGGNPWDLQVHNPDFYGRVLTGGSLAMGESYMDGWWDCDDLAGMFERLTRAGIQRRVRPASLVFPYVKEQLLNMQTRRRSRKVARQHYDRGNDLYEAMLDPYMQYTCAYWKDADNLDQAQRDKLDLICRKLQLRPGMRVLDTGCGFGGFARYAAEHHGVEVYGVTLSKEQAAFGTELCKGLPVTLEVKDYRDVTERNFDRVASIGIMEHVGTKNYRAYLRQMSRCLKDDGLMLLHTIGSEITGKVTDRWIAKYIFPNSILPSAAELTRAAEQVLVLEDWHNFGASYAKTLLAWNANCEAAWGRLPADRYDERFRRMWRYYLLTCAGAFASRSIHLWQLVLSKGGMVGGYDAPR